MKKGVDCIGVGVGAIIMNSEACHCEKPFDKLRVNWATRQSAFFYFFEIGWFSVDEVQTMDLSLVSKFNFENYLKYLEAKKT